MCQADWPTFDLGKCKDFQEVPSPFEKLTFDTVLDTSFSWKGVYSFIPFVIGKNGWIRVCLGGDQQLYL